MRGLKLKIHRVRRGRKMARRRTSRRTRTVYRKARRTSRRGRGLFKGGGGIMSQTWNGFKDGQAYRIVASKFAPSLAPIAQAYGEYKGGGIAGFLVNELVINGLVGTPGILGSINLLSGLGGLLPGLGGSTSSMPSGAV